MSVQKTTNADKGVTPIFDGKLDLKLFAGAVLEKPAAEIPAAPATMPTVADLLKDAYARRDVAGEAFVKLMSSDPSNKEGRATALDALKAGYADVQFFESAFGMMTKKYGFSGELPASLNPIKFSHIKDILARKSQTKWLPGLKDILECMVLALLVAQRNTFKSFIALEWAMRAAVAGCGVVVLSGEGGGLDRRMDAWVRTHGRGIDPDKLKFVALEKPVNLNDAQVLAFVTDRVRELGWPLDLFVVDTLSKFTPGLEENDNTENAKFLTALSDAIRYKFDATVLLVAHAGHNEPGRPRGASTLMANPDAEYVVERREMFVKVSRERLKDSPSLPPLAYQGKPVDLGRCDENMRPITSLAFTLTNAEAMPATFKPLGGNQKLAWAALKGLLVSNKEAPPCVQPPGQPSVPYLTALEALKVSFEGNVKPSRAATSAIDDLVDKGYLARDAGWLWMKDKDTSGRDIRDTP